jgi:pantothenate kinase
MDHLKITIDIKVGDRYYHPYYKVPIEVTNLSSNRVEFVHKVSPNESVTNENIIRNCVGHLQRDSMEILSFVRYFGQSDRIKKSI